MVRSNERDVIFYCAGCGRELIDTTIHDYTIVVLNGVRRFFDTPECKDNFIREKCE